MGKPLSTFILIFIISNTFAQTESSKITGTVLSAYSGEPISGATIMFTRTSGTLTDSSGQFAIKGLSAGQYTLSFTAFGYDKIDTTITLKYSDLNIKWIIHTGNCLSFSRETALRDIKKGKPVLLLQGGIAPVVYSTDEIFRNKYNVGLYDFGCVAGDKQDCLKDYNKTIFQYLDTKFGRTWRR
ncbi:MAG TPA: carboxypeptidase-like regulatory domain-containing protein, partial [Chitinophagaceae bacterium]|nr:carboxypeptidase-like regulatory domain-containing protein [Chitinophagaceae bacterium]